VESSEKFIESRQEQGMTRQSRREKRRGKQRKREQSRARQKSEKKQEILYQTRHRYLGIARGI
jgi:hypothetical protein